MPCRAPSSTPENPHLLRTSPLPSGSAASPGRGTGKRSPAGRLPPPRSSAASVAESMAPRRRSGLGRVTVDLLQEADDPVDHLSVLQDSEVARAAGDEQVGVIEASQHLLRADQGDVPVVPVMDK